MGRLVTILSERRSRAFHSAPEEEGNTRRKREVLARAAAEVDGFWAAGLQALDAPASTTKATCDAPQAHYLPVDYPADEVCPLLNSPEAHTAHLQITYGCPAFCSFCFEAYDRKPYREIPMSNLLGAAL